jgi:hypothetical protein
MKKQGHTTCALAFENAASNVPFFAPPAEADAAAVATGAAGFAAGVVCIGALEIKPSSYRGKQQSEKPNSASSGWEEERERGRDQVE